MNVSLRRSYRLVTRGGAGLACDRDGLALGAVDLAHVRLDEGCATRCEVRSPDEIGQILRTAYGPQPDGVVLRVYQGLALEDDWKPNNPSNLIGLPADEATQRALGDLLPMHNDFHPK